MRESVLGCACACAWGVFASNSAMPIGFQHSGSLPAEIVASIKATHKKLSKVFAPADATQEHMCLRSANGFTRTHANTCVLWLDD